MEPSRGGIGIKLKIPNNKFKKQNIIAKRKIEEIISPEIWLEIKEKSPLKNELNNLVFIT